jgi:hypothetical protein
MMREKRGWMVKEADSPLLGWEVYARKEAINNETGICMVADATKILEAGKEPGKEGPVEPARDALYRAFEDFTRSVRESSRPACGAAEGYQAAVVAIKANEQSCRREGPLSTNNVRTQQGGLDLMKNIYDLSRRDFIKTTGVTAAGLAAGKSVRARY